MLCVAWGSLGACASGPSEPQDVLELLEAPEQADDAFAESPVAVPEGLVAGSQRWVGETGVARYWAAVGADGEVCLVGYLAGAAPTYGSTCASLEAFASRGLQLGVRAGGTTADAWLLPDDDDDTAAVEAQGYRSVAANLLAKP